MDTNERGGLKGRISGPNWFLLICKESREEYTL